jgi:hypothetical protein
MASHGQMTLARHDSPISRPKLAGVPLASDPLSLAVVPQQRRMHARIKTAAPPSLHTNTTTFALLPFQIRLRLVPIFDFGRPFIETNNTLSSQELALCTTSPSLHLHRKRLRYQPPATFKMRFSLAALFIGTATAAMVGSMSHPGGDSLPTGGHGDGPPPHVTSTIYTTRESTVYACPSTVKDCPVESKTAAAVVTDTIVLGTTICPLTESHTAAPMHTKSCMGSSETCTVTVTRKGPPPFSAPHNATAVGAHATGTG